MKIDVNQKLIKMQFEANTYFENKLALEKRTPFTMRYILNVTLTYNIVVHDKRLENHGPKSYTLFE